MLISQHNFILGQLGWLYLNNQYSVMSTIDTSNILVYIVIHNAITLNIINSKEVPLRLDMDDIFIGVQYANEWN